MTATSTLMTAESRFLESRIQAHRLNGQTESVARIAAHFELNRVRKQAVAKLASKPPQAKPTALAAPRPAPATRHVVTSAAQELTPYQRWLRDSGKQRVNGIVQLTAKDVASMGPSAGHCMSGGLLEI